MIEEQYANLSIEDDDEEGLVIEEGEEDGSKSDLALCLVGSFLTNRKINFGAMQDTLSSIWRPVKEVFMEETVIPNIFLFKFFHQMDKQRVLEDGPWTFNNQALIVKRLELGEQLSDIKLQELFIWIQVYDLPLGFNSESILKSIENYDGRFLQSDAKNFQGIWKQFLRIKVAINVYNPLKRQMRIKKPRGEWMWIKFKDERLPTFCFYCGLIGHSEKFCELLYDDKGKIGDMKYDASLRAPMKKQVSVKENQWIRNSDGGKLSAKNTEANEDDGLTSEIGSKAHDCRDLQCQTSEKEGEFVESRILKQDIAYLNKGVNQGLVRYQNQEVVKKGANSVFSNSNDLPGREDIVGTEIEGITVADNNKKRKTEFGPEEDKEGNTEIPMGLEKDVSEFMDQDSDIISRISNNPKNGLKAGFRTEVRLPQ